MFRWLKIHSPTMTTDIEDEIKDEKNPRPLDEDDIALLKTYKVEEFIIGLPISSDGKETPQSNKVRSVAGRIVIQAAERLYHLLPMVYQAFVSVLKPITLLQLHGIIRCWEVTKTGTSVSTVAKTSMAHDNPVLCSAWKDDGTTVFSGGCDKQVKMWPLLSGGQPTTVAMHDSPVTQVAWIPEMNLLVSGSLDKTLRYWYLRTVNPVHTQQLPDCCYSLTVRHPLMVVATADRNLIAFNLQNPQIFYLVGFGLFCLESLLSFWVLQRVYIFFRGNK